MTRRVPPPDFRYVWLAPARSSLTLAVVGVTATATLAGTLLRAGAHPGAGAVFLTGAALGASALARGLVDHLRHRRSARPPLSPSTPRSDDLPAREAAMAVVPWGVIVDPDTEPRVLRWPAIQRVAVEVVHAVDGGTPVAVASLVTVETVRERFTGRALGAVGLEGLTVNLEAYAEEAARPVALDLDGLVEAGDGGTEPVMADLLARADDLCTTGRGALLLGLPAGGYRSMASGTAGPETVALLRAILDAPPVTSADARPLASIVAVLLDARELAPDLLRLVSAPHPVVAAVAKAAALRLGAPQSRAGAVDEVAAFLFEEDYQRLERWAEGA